MFILSHHELTLYPLTVGIYMTISFLGLKAYIHLYCRSMLMISPPLPNASFDISLDYLQVSETMRVNQQPFKHFF